MIFFAVNNKSLLLITYSMALFFHILNAETIDTIKATKHRIKEIVEESNKSHYAKAYKFTEKHSAELILFLNTYPQLIDVVVKKSICEQNEAILDFIFKKSSVDINMHFSDTNETPIVYAMHNNRKMLEYFLSYETIDVNATDAIERTPLHNAVICGDFFCVSLLLNQPNIILDLKDSTGLTPLHHAVLLGLFDAILQEEADRISSYLPTYMTKKAYNVHKLIQTYRPILYKLISAGSSKEEKNIFGRTPIDLLKELVNSQKSDSEAKTLINSLLEYVNTLEKSEPKPHEWHMVEINNVTIDETIQTDNPPTTIVTDNNATIGQSTQTDCPQSSIRVMQQEEPQVHLKTKINACLICFIAGLLVQPVCEFLSY